MPYIDPDSREDIGNLHRFPETCGELNWIVSDAIHCYMKRTLGRDDYDTVQMRYAKINEVIGVLECAKLELYRQIAAPYEDIKKAQNGPVSELDRGH